MDIFVIVMGYALMGTWYVHHKRKGGVKRHQLLDDLIEATKEASHV